MSSFGDLKKYEGQEVATDVSSELIAQIQQLPTPQEVSPYTKQGRYDATLLCEGVEEEFEIRVHPSSGEFFTYDPNDGIYRENKIALERKILAMTNNEASSKLIQEVLNKIRILHTWNNKSDINANLFVFNNGVYDLETHTLSRFDSMHLLFNKLPYDYDSTADCPKFKKFLSEILIPADIPLIQEIIGYCLHRDTPVHKAFIFVGEGANGKSTLLSVITQILGVENVSSESLQSLVSERFAIVNVKDKLANICSDLPSEGLKRTDVFKKLTSGDLVIGEQKFQKRFQFKSYAKLLFSCNLIPSTPDNSRAFFRRCLIVKFPNRFEGLGADTRLLDKLTNPKELSGIFNWAIEGLQRLLVNREFSRQEATDEVREYWIKMSDSVHCFLDDLIEEDVMGYVTTEDMYQAYQEYCVENKLIASSMRGMVSIIKKTFPHVRRERSMTDDNRHLRGWRGLSIAI